MPCTIKKEDSKTKNIVIQISQNLTLFHLKNALSARLKIPRGRLKLMEVNKNIVLNEKYDREPISNKGYVVDILPSQLPKQEMPSYNISNCGKIQNKLIEYMNLDEELAEEIWKLMRSFPTNKTFQTKLFGLNLLIKDNAYDAWSRFLETNDNIHYILYSIHEIKKILKKTEDSGDYLGRFILKEGFSYLRVCYKSLLKLSSKCYSYTTARLIKYLMEAMTILLKSY